jgi:cytochrome c oxidase assembly protein subunit 15
VTTPATHAMHATAAARTSVDRRPLLRKYAWFVVFYNVLVILWGAIVRATGSGAGCGNHWPLCNGEVIPHSPQVATMVEFTHRMMTGGATFTILALLIWTFRSTTKWHLARVMAVLSTVLLVNEAFLGALLVKLGYVVQNQSAGRFVVLPIHLANTLLLLAALALTAHFLARDEGFMRGSVDFRSLPLTITALLTTLVVGVSGSLAALGDTLFPATSFSAAIAQDFSAKSFWLLRWRWSHPALSLLAAACIVWLFAQTRSPRATETDRRLGVALLGLLLLQIGLGVADVLLLAPTWMQIVHLAGADSMWIALVVLSARVSVRPLGCMGMGNVCSVE